MQRVAGFREGLTFVQESADPNLFATEVRNCAGSTINLGVFSAKVSLLPHVHLRPKHYIVSIIFIMHDTNVSLFLQLIIYIIKFTAVHPHNSNININLI